MEQSLVSIIVPVYNGEAYLEASLKSCLAQTYQNIEVIVVNDCSTDASLDIATSFAAKDSRVTVITNETNKKLPATLNVGHRAAKGTYISWTSDDNLYRPTAITQLVTQLITTDSDIAFSGYTIIYANGLEKRTIHPIDTNHLLLGNTIGASFIYKKEVFKRNNGYDEQLHTVEDYDFWLRAFLHSKYHYIRENLYQYRIHDKSLTAQVSEASNSAQERFEQNIQKSYHGFFSAAAVTSPTKMAALFFNLNRNKEINIRQFLKEYTTFTKELKQLIVKTPNTTIFDNLQQMIDLKLRQNLFAYPKNKTIKTIAIIFAKRPQLLIRYDRKRSLQYIIDCFIK